MAESLWSRVHPRVRRALRAHVLARDGAVCKLCGEPIDLSLPRYHPWSFQLDHIVSPLRGGSLTDPANHQPAHRRCNLSKHARPEPRHVESRPKLQW